MRAVPVGTGRQTSVPGRCRSRKLGLAGSAAAGIEVDVLGGEGNEIEGEGQGDEEVVGGLARVRTGGGVVGFGGRNLAFGPGEHVDGDAAGEGEGD